MSETSVILQTDGIRHKLPQWYLSKHSKLFANLFNGKGQSASAAQLEIEDDSVETVYHLKKVKAADLEVLLRVMDDAM